MALYEVVREIKNLCPNNQMRDISIDEVEIDDPEAYVRRMLRGKQVEVTASPGADGCITIYASADGLTQQFSFTPV